jgi:hypothetical protein
VKRSAPTGADWKVKAAFVLGAVLSWSVYRGWSAGTIDTNAALVRVGVAMAFAYAGIAVVASVVQGYLPEPEPDGGEEAPQLEGVEDAVLVDQLEAHEETTAEG